MIAALSRWMLLLLMRSRAERHSGCRIDVARVAIDPEYASAIRTLAQFTLDEELSAIGALAGRIQRGSKGSGRAPPGFTADTTTPTQAEPTALVLPFRRQATV